MCSISTYRRLKFNELMNDIQIHHNDKIEINYDSDMLLILISLNL
jgi:hypothetical protein